MRTDLLAQGFDLLAQHRADHWPHRYLLMLGGMLALFHDAGYRYTPEPHWPPAPDDVWRQRLEAEIQAGMATFGADAMPDADHLRWHHYLEPPD